MRAVWSLLSDAIKRPDAHTEPEGPAHSARDETGSKSCCQADKGAGAALQVGCCSLTHENGSPAVDQDSKGCESSTAGTKSYPVPADKTRESRNKHGSEQEVHGKILYASQKGTSAAFARRLAEKAKEQGWLMPAADLANYEVEHLWKEQLIVLVMSTYEGGSPPETARCVIP